MKKIECRWVIKGCPTCGGDLFADRYDLNGLACLQCGRSFHARSPEEEARLRADVGHRRKARLPMR